MSELSGRPVEKLVVALIVPSVVEGLDIRLEGRLPDSLHLVAKNLQTSTAQSEDA